MTRYRITIHRPLWLAWLPARTFDMEGTMEEAVGMVVQEGSGHGSTIDPTPWWPAELREAYRQIQKRWG